MSDKTKKKVSAASPFVKGRSLSGGGEERQPSKFMKVKADEPLLFAPLEELAELVSFNQHEFWDANPAVMIPCIGTGCPACAAGNKPKYKAMLNAVQVSGGSVASDAMLLPMGITVNRQLESMAEELETIRGVVFKLRKSGTGLSTKYVLITTGKTVPVKGIEPIDVAEQIQVFSKAEIVEKLAALGLGDDDDDDDDEPAAVAPKKAAAPKGKAKGAAADDDDEFEDV